MTPTKWSNFHSQNLYNPTTTQKANIYLFPQKISDANVFNERCTKSLSSAKTKTCESSKTPLTPQLTPKSRKQCEIDTSELPPGLAKIVTVWPELPPHIKAAIKALIQTYEEEAK
jgi:hypothetical protein